ncbi:hypothetical protein [Rhizobium paknamense]|uniref:Lysozyme inhibitor n=1 Tax=Rhizobium paknamense TaxID=1206817 RepID=A0ABU0I9T2_9HYPH|nr:hypothetical protein [Rhizobium paknamense]MDQ0454462.1 hypothetical protein [Rhizobium paknamense]
MKTRFTVAALLVASAASSVDADDLTSTPPDIACRDEMILLEVWHAQGVVGYVEYPQKDEGILHVYVRGWDKTAMEHRRRIVLAAYCPIAVQAGRGRLWWGSQDGRLLVVDGQIQPLDFR